LKSVKLFRKPNGSELDFDLIQGKENQRKGMDEWGKFSKNTRGKLGNLEKSIMFTAGDK